MRESPNFAPVRFKVVNNCVASKHQVTGSWHLLLRWGRDRRLQAAADKQG
jgi:hypothetical protein